MEAIHNKNNNNNKTTATNCVYLSHFRSISRTISVGEKIKIKREQLQHHHHHHHALYPRTIIIAADSSCSLSGGDKKND
jgi:ABC-type transport system involved in cytochrome c biogenesis ATPase subunit